MPPAPSLDPSPSASPTLAAPEAEWPAAPPLAAPQSEWPAGPPRLPTPPRVDPDPPSAPAPRRGRRVAIAAAVVALVAGSFAVGRVSRSAAPAAEDVDGGPADRAPSTARADQQVDEPVDEPVAAVAERLGPSVVSINAPAGDGSGVIVSDDGLVLTAAHVVARADEVDVVLADGREYRGRVVVDRPDLDLAAIRIEADGLPAASLAEDSPTVGQLAIAMGSPFGFDQTVSSGIVSALNRTVEVGGRTLSGLVQTDAPINPGSSGGPLVDRDGDILGINVVIASRSGGNDGVGFAVPVEQIREILDQDPGAGGPTVRPEADSSPGDRGGIPRLPAFPDPPGLDDLHSFELPAFGWLPDDWSGAAGRSERRSGASDVSIRIEAGVGADRIVAEAITVDDATEALDERAPDDATEHAVRGGAGRSWSDGDRRTLMWAEAPDTLAWLDVPIDVTVEDAVRIADSITGDLS